MALMDRFRSRSRGRSEATLHDRPDFYEWQLAQKEKEIEEFNKKQLWEKDMELKRIKDAAQKKADADRAEQEQKRFIQDYEDKKRKEVERAKAEEARIKDKMEREKQEAKEEEKRILEKIEREKREAKEREEREWKDFLRKQKEKEDKEKAEKKAEEERVQKAMRRRLEEFGYTQAQIDIMVDEEKTKKYKAEQRPARGPSPGNAVTPWKPNSPTYAKVHRDHLSIDTLIYYDVPYEFDRVRLTTASVLVFLYNLLTFEYRRIPTTSSSCARWTSTRPRSCSSTRSASAPASFCSRLRKTSHSMHGIANATAVKAGCESWVFWSTRDDDEVTIRPRCAS